MEKALLILVNVINYLHDFIVNIFRFLGFGLTDKDLHFWFVGIIGTAIFVLSDLIFRYVTRWSISVISFIYTCTVLIVVVFGLEIEQKITGRGAMEFADIVSGLWGFIAILSVFLAIKATLYLTKKFYKKFSSKAR
ncbi:hypothetical protein [Pelotomaculum schinkii]|uniref:hypothetical protein n=1 Tax=Pelotomaculum schinkii TaxID=78350 RepID=UPI00167E640D|nr:hypothetical protein [Pelotomaculum schinkii]